MLQFVAPEVRVETRFHGIQRPFEIEEILNRTYAPPIASIFEGSNLCRPPNEPL